MQPKYPNIKVQLIGQDGNAFMVLGLVGRALRKAGVSQEEAVNRSLAIARAVPPAGGSP